MHGQGTSASSVVAGVSFLDKVVAREKVKINENGTEEVICRAQRVRTPLQTRTPSRKVIQRPMTAPRNLQASSSEDREENVSMKEERNRRRAEERKMALEEENKRQEKVRNL